MLQCKKIQKLVTKAIETLQPEKQKWHIAYMGEITTLGTLYIIAKPVAGEQIQSARVFVAPGGNLKQSQEIHVKQVNVYRGNGIGIETSYGTFRFSRDYNKMEFYYGSGEVYGLYEYTFLN